MDHVPPPGTENHSVPLWPDPDWRPAIDPPPTPPPPDPPPELPADRRLFRTRKKSKQTGKADGLADNHRGTPRARKRGFWHHLLLQIAGLCCYAVLIGLAAFTWGYAVYSRQGYINGEELLPVYIFLGAIFISSCLITALSHGGAIFPALLFSLLANGASFLLAELTSPPLSALLLKLGLSLLVAAVGFTLTKLLLLIGKHQESKTV